MSNHTIAPQITTWTEARHTDREVLNRAEVAGLLALDPRTIDHAIADGTIPAVHVGRRVLIPRRPFLATFGALFEAPDSDGAVRCDSPRIVEGFSMRLPGREPRWSRS